MPGSSRVVVTSGEGVIGGVSTREGDMELSSGTGSSVDTDHLMLAGGGDSSPLAPNVPQALPAASLPRALSALALTLVSPFHVPVHLSQTLLLAPNPHSLHWLEDPGIP